MKGSTERNIPKEKDPNSGSIVLVFGQGPVEESQHPHINSWSQDLARATSILLNRYPSISKAVLLGGKTGGEDFDSEAEYIADAMEGFGTKSEKIITEEFSKDTIENIINFINQNPDLIDQEILVVTSPFHTTRVGILMNFFGINAKYILSSTEINKYSLSDSLATKDLDEWDQEDLSKIETMIDISDPIKLSGKFDKDLRKTALYRYHMEDVLTRELFEYPEKWIPHLASIQNPNSFILALKQAKEIFNEDFKRLKIDSIFDELDGLGEDSIKRVRLKLKSIPEYKGLSKPQVEEWIDENNSKGWPVITLTKLYKLYRQSENPIQ